MTPDYQRLLELAKEVDVPSTTEKIIELNKLLVNLSKDDINDLDIQVIDELICILLNTDNILHQNVNKIKELLDSIRNVHSETFP